IDPQQEGRMSFSGPPDAPEEPALPGRRRGRRAYFTPASAATMVAPVSTLKEKGRHGARTDRHSGFEAWYEAKSFSSRSGAEGGAYLRRGSATPIWAISPISLSDAAAFGPGCVAGRLWCGAPRSVPRLSGTE